MHKTPLYLPCTTSYVGYSCLTGIYFGGSKTEKNRIPEDFFFFLCVSGGIFHRNVVLEGVAKIQVLGRYHRIFLQEFLRDRNSWIYSGFLRIPPDSSGFLFPPKAVWLRPATKEGSLLSKIWTKIDLFHPLSQLDLTMASTAPVL
jgi:hypothetical protein